jgi:hypothetical protein
LSLLTTQTSMPPGGLEPAIPAIKRPQTYALDRTAIHHFLQAEIPRLGVIRFKRCFSGPSWSQTTRSSCRIRLNPGPFICHFFVSLLPFHPAATLPSNFMPSTKCYWVTLLWPTNLSHGLVRISKVIHCYGLPWYSRSFDSLYTTSLTGVGKRQ